MNSRAVPPQTIASSLAAASTRLPNIDEASSWARNARTEGTPGEGEEKGEVRGDGALCWHRATPVGRRRVLQNAERSCIVDDEFLTGPLLRWHALSARDARLEAIN